MAGVSFFPLLYILCPMWSTLNTTLYSYYHVTILLLYQVIIVDISLELP